MDKSFAKGLAVLELLARAPKPCGVSEIARKLDMGKSNVHRLLQTLTTCGFVEQDEDRGYYRPALKMWVLGTLAIARLNIRGAAFDVLAELATHTGEAAQLSVLVGGDMINIEKRDSPQATRYFTPLNGFAAAYCCTRGMVMLAYSSTDVVEAAMESMLRDQSRTALSPARLERELEKIRAQGYGVGEWKENVSCVATPVWGPDDDVAAILSVSAPSFRTPVSAIEKFAPLLIASARTISNRIGLPEGSDLA
ncbi:IclR family transcriptional regulator [Telmatospirillum siberiense]|uniref:IclR family transcriptional regulator n=1 Tax=Telmatospirillum siberiense TaxID=382514 RepID=UPI001304654F|nr:IclR family transcriptional regulator [Telmatospirillum siberiense]